MSNPKVAKEKKYSILNDNKLIAIIILLLAIIFQIGAYVNTPVVSTIHAYTIGMILGRYSFIFYLYCIFFSFIMLLKPLKFSKYIQIIKINYWLFFISLMMFLVSWTYIWNGLSIKTIGPQIFKKSFIDNWWIAFSSHNPWTPPSEYGGILGAFLFSLIAIFSSVIGAAIIFTIILGLTISFCITGSLIGLYKSIIKRRKFFSSKKNENDDMEYQPFSIVTKEDPFIDASDDLDELISEKNTNAEEELPFEDITMNIEKNEDTSNIKYDQISFSSILERKKVNNTSKIRSEILMKASKLEDLFKTFDLQAQVVDKINGPTITKFIVEPGPGINLKKFETIEKNMKMILAAPEIRLELPIPGESRIGIEVPNKERSLVTFHEVFKQVIKQKNLLPVAFGQLIDGEPLIIDICETPHMLIAGATGSGKSIAINAIIASLIMNYSPSEVKFLLIDPKYIEFISYENIPHLLAPIITDPARAASAMKILVNIMEKRYQEMSKLKVRKISEYNKKAIVKGLKPWPYIVVIIDELADLMASSSRAVESSIQRLTQKARAAGIHLILSTQRPSTNVVTGVIKANVPSRVSFSVSSGVDSKVILDTVGAERLIGQGDMLISLYGKHIQRAQGTYLSNEEIHKLVRKAKKFGKPKYGVEFEIIMDNDLSDKEDDQITQEIYNN